MLISDAEALLESQVVVPRSPIQAKGLLLGTIFDSLCVLTFADPPDFRSRHSRSKPRREFSPRGAMSSAHLSSPSQLFLEPKILYRSAVEQVPTGDYQLPLSSAEVLQEGTDLTIVSYGPPLYTIEGALHLLKNPTEDIQSLIPEDLRHLSVELIDLRTIAPYDVSPAPSWSKSGADCAVPQIETVVKSVNKTGRCIVVHEASKTGGVGSELAAEVQERCFLRLEAPVGRITGWDTPFGLAYEKFYLPDQLRIVSRFASLVTFLSLTSALSPPSQLDSVIETMRY